MMRPDLPYRALQALLALTIVCGLALMAHVACAQVPANANIYRMQLRAESQRVMGVNAPVSMLAAQITQESGWNASVTAWDGGRGLGQFMPPTQVWACAKFRAALGDEPCDAYRPRAAMRLQAAYMQYLHGAVKRADSQCDRWAFALMGYNSGEAWRMTRQRLSPRPGNAVVTAAINPGVTPANQRIAQDYPHRVQRVYEPRFVAAGWGVGSCTCAPTGSCP